LKPAPKLLSLCLSLALVLGACGRLEFNRESTFGDGGSIVSGLSEIGILDPPRASGPSALALLRTACDGLVGLDPDSGAVRPALAAGWSLEAGARKIAIDLRPGMTFHDGSAVTSAAVREALSRVARPSTTSPWAGLVSKVEGFGEVQAGTSTHLSGVKATEDVRLEIDLSEPFSDFPTILSHPALIPVSLDSLKSNPEGPAQPVCSGPYLIETGLEGGDLRLARTTQSVSRNDAYLGGGRGLAERILVRSFETPEDAYQAYKSGVVDIAPIPDSRLGEALAGGEGYTGRSTPQITYLAFDPANPATADPRVRQAISLAIDRLVIIDAAYGDERRPATRWLPGNYGSGTKTTCADFARRIGDPVKAKQLLEASGFDPANQISLIYDPRATTRVVAEALQIQIRDTLGVSLSPQPLEGEDIAASFKARTGAPSAWIMATNIELPLPDQFLGDLFRSGSQSNLLQFSDKTFDARIGSARTATAQAEIERLYVEAENALCDQMPAIPLWTSVSHWMINPEQVEFQGERKLDLLGGPLLRHASATG
jgi:oligopeptide transport system substrate-binding protein